MDSAAISTPPSRDHADGDLWALPSAARDDATPSSSARVKLLVSFGGRIQLRSHDNQLSYVGGDTKILALDRATARFPVLLARLATLVGVPSSSGLCLKYQLPGEDLDALVSVTNDEDLEQMIIEYDRLHKHRRVTQKPTARLRLFLFTIVLPPPPPPATSSVLLDHVAAAPTIKKDPQWFVDALNSMHLQPASMAPALDESKAKVSRIPDFLLGLEEGFVPPPAVHVKGRAPKSPGADAVANYYNLNDGHHQQQAPMPGIVQQIGSSVEKLTAKANYPLQPEYHLWPPEHHGSALATSAAGTFTREAAGGDQAMFLIPAGAAGQGYYAAAGIGQVYREARHG